MVLIRRSLVMMGYLARLGTKNTYKAKFEALSAALDDAPTVDAEPVRHGKWIKSDYPQHDDDSLYVYYNYHCSKCEGMADDRRWLPRYCPNCGAKMDGDEVDGG